MIEIIIMLWILPRRFFPLARERGRSGLLWTLAAAGAWMGAEVFVVFVYAVVYFVGAPNFGWHEDIDKQPLTFFVYALALVAGLLSADMIRKILTAIPKMNPTTPPPPTAFSQP